MEHPNLPVKDPQEQQGSGDHQQSTSRSKRQHLAPGLHHLEQNKYHSIMLCRIMTDWWMLSCIPWRIDLSPCMMEMFDGEIIIMIGEHWQSCQRTKTDMHVLTRQRICRYHSHRYIWDLRLKPCHGFGHLNCYRLWTETLDWTHLDFYNCFFVQMLAWVFLIAVSSKIKRSTTSSKKLCLLFSRILWE
jgi:hypothetical protein